jgi:hypothetical protein
VFEIAVFLVAITATLVAPLIFWLSLVNGMLVLSNEGGYIWPAWDRRFSPFDSSGWLALSGAQAILYGGASSLFGLVMTMLCGAAGYTGGVYAGIPGELVVVIQMALMACSSPLTKALVRRSELSDEIKQGLTS